MASDGCNTMIGMCNSFFKHLQSEPVKLVKYYPGRQKNFFDQLTIMHQGVQKDVLF
ncbi:hypothetical protein BDFB_014116, partial [Asbolus verrucosus]